MHALKHIGFTQTCCRRENRQALPLLRHQPRLHRSHVRLGDGNAHIP